MITLQKIDNVYMHVDPGLGGDGILLELHDYFAFYVPGYKFQKPYMNGVWDGRIKLFSAWERKLYIGLLPYLEEFCKTFGHQLEIPDEFKLEEKVTPQELKEFVKRVNPLKKGKPITPRYYQMIGLYNMINRERCVLVSPTASGKSLMIYLFSRWFMENYPGEKIVITVPTTNLVEQMYSDMLDYSDGATKNEVHRIYSGRDKVNESYPIYVTTWQSVYELSEEYFNDFACITVDECHGAKAKSLKQILEKCNAEYRFGLTGTMHDPEAHKWVIEGLLGEAIDLITLKELQEKKYISKLKINCVVFDYQEKPGPMTYPDEINWIIDNETRTNKILKAVGSVDENAFVLFDKVRYGEVLYERAKELFPDRKVELVYGATSVEDRETIRKALEDENGTIVIASYKVFSTGISIDNLHHVFFAEPAGKSMFKIMQSIGRTLRLHEDKEYAYLWDFVDALTTSKKKMNHTMRHFMDRVAKYNEEKQEYRITRVEI